MTNEIFIARSIDELPKESGWYEVKKGKITKAMFWFNSIRKVWLKSQGGSKVDTKYYDAWLSPITIEQLIAEHPEEVEEIFEAARSYWVIDEGVNEDYSYPTATDYINSLK